MGKAEDGIAQLAGAGAGKFRADLFEFFFCGEFVFRELEPGFQRGDLGTATARDGAVGGRLVDHACAELDVGRDAPPGTFTGESAG